MSTSLKRLEIDDDLNLASDDFIITLGRSVNFSKVLQELIVKTPSTKQDTASYSKLLTRIEKKSMLSFHFGDNFCAVDLVSAVKYTLLSDASTKLLKGRLLTLDGTDACSLFSYIKKNGVCALQFLFGKVCKGGILLRVYDDLSLQGKDLDSDYLSEFWFALHRWKN